jgi:hypothetical protein
VESDGWLPIYIKYNSILPLQGNDGIDLIVYGEKAEIKMYDSNIISLKDDRITFSNALKVDTIEFKGLRNVKNIYVNDKEYKVENNKVSIKENIREIILKY